MVLKISWGNENKRRDKLSEAEVREKYTEQELVEMGDNSPLYRYVL